MANDIRPVEPEKPLNQEVHIEIPEVAEVSTTPESTSVEAEPSLERASEALREGGSAQENVPTEAEEAPVQQAPVTRRKAPAAPQPLDRLEEEIEDILEEDLKEMYASMPPDKQAVFREKGEETRSKIRELVGSAKINAKKVFSLIRGWLKIIPGVNRFFLEQEAKIKTDKILLVSEEERKQTQNESL